MPGLTKSAKKAIMRSLSSRTLQTSDYWEYAVSRSWLESWDECISRSLSRESVDDSFSGGRGNPLTMSADDAENTYIPESQWKIYVALFGVDGKHELRRRPIYTMYKNLDYQRNPILGDHVIADNELDFLHLRVGFLNEMASGLVGNLKPLKVYAWDSISYIGKQARTVLELKKSVTTRLWLCILSGDVQRESEKIVFEPVVDETQVLLSKLLDFTPNLKQLLMRRSLQLNPKYFASYQDRSINPRQPLWVDVERMFESRPLFYALGVEETGVCVKNKGNLDLMSDPESEQAESIVMISSIQNEWEDVLTNFVDKYTEDMSQNTEELRERLLSSAKEIVGEKLGEIVEIRADFEKRFAMLEVREQEVERKEKENRDKDLDIADRLAKYKRGIEDFQRQKKKFTEDVERIQAQNKMAEARVTLNIGGILYTTSLMTLTKEENSLLALIFSGKHPIHREPDGTYFIDRDGVNFRYILNYLRDGVDTVNALPFDQKLIRELHIEAKYYGLEELVRLLQNKLQC